MRTWVIAAVSVMISTTAQADSLRVAQNVGSIVGSQEGCGFTFSQAGIQRYINARVPADDIEFPGNLGLYIRTQQRRVGRMSGDERQIHCTQVARTAKALGFMD